MQKLYILPFDHRGSFMKIVGASSAPSDKDVAKARSYKKIIYEAFKRSVKNGAPKDKAGILVDEWLGKDILLDAHKAGFITCTPLEKSGQDEFDFDREDWQHQVEELNPTIVKVLVRYNPEGDQELNRRQNMRLAKLSNFLSDRDNKFMLELLVPATDAQLKKAGSQEKYDAKMRYSLMIKAIKEMQEAGINPDVWKIEGLDDAKQMQQVADQVTAFNPDSGIIILGRGESAQKAEQWLKVGASIKGAIGFAVGRTIFKDALEQLSAGKVSKDDAIKKISDNYSFFVKVWESASRG